MNHRYSTTAKVIAISIQQLMAVLLLVFLVLIGNLFNKSMLEFQDIGKKGFEDSAYFTQEFKETTSEVQQLVGLREKFETEGLFDVTKPIAINGEISYRLGDLQNWAEKGCSYRAAGYLSLVEESYPAVKGGGYIERYLNEEISTQEAINISNAMEKIISSIADEVNQYKRLINQYDTGKSNVSYYYNMQGKNYSNLAAGTGDKEEAKSQIENKGRYLYYDDQDIRFDTNVHRLEDYFYKDVNYITGNMDSNAVFIMGVDTTLPHKDHFYEAKETYNSLYPWIKISIVSTLFSLIGWIAALVYLSTVTGRNSHEDEVHLNGFDRIKTEIFFFLAIVGAGAGGFMAAITGNQSWETSGVLIMAGVCAFVENAIFLLFYLSFIRRARSGVLWSGSILYLFYRILREGYESRKTTGKFVFVYLIQSASILTLAAWGYYYTQPLFLAALAILIVLTGIMMLKDQIQRQKIMEGIEKIKSGNLEYKIDTENLTGENKILSEGINNLGEGLEKAVDSSMKNERMKADLITNVSHDIKTPLTSIINYVNLLENEQMESEKVRGYIHILKEKSTRLEQLTEDLVEASKISSGNIVLDMVRINLVELVYQTGGEFNEKFEKQELTVYTKLPKEPVVIMADGRRIWRVLENLYNNVAKYALVGTRVYVEVEEEEDEARFSIKNISSKPLNIPSEELTERFIRGDVSRSTEGSGLGLSIAQSLTTLMGGTFDIILDGDLFKVLLRFPLAF
ncbi:MAG: HAMP domain-containing histidine kinase [Lachnospiraceae bacterium]|nr:HAMP domain-containing histidine kinase [Lachnospiraceae bacterium]